MIALYNFRIKKAGTYSRILKQKYLLTSTVQTYDTDPVFQIPSPGWDTGDGLLGAAGEVVFDAGAGEEGAVAADDGPFEEEGGGAGCLGGREAGAGGVAVKAV